MTDTISFTYGNTYHFLPELKKKTILYKDFPEEGVRRVMKVKEWVFLEKKTIAKGVLFKEVVLEKSRLDRITGKL